MFYVEAQFCLNSNHLHLQRVKERKNEIRSWHSKCFWISMCIKFVSADQMDALHWNCAISYHLWKTNPSIQDFDLSCEWASFQINNSRHSFLPLVQLKQWIRIGNFDWVDAQPYKHTHTYHKLIVWLLWANGTFTAKVQKTNNGDFDSTSTHSIELKFDSWSRHHRTSIPGSLFAIN